MENLITAVSTLVKNAYNSNYPPLAGSQQAEYARRALEIKMLFGSSFPDAFKTVIVELFKKDGLLEIVRNEIDPAKLFFADFSMLEVDEDAASVAKRKSSHVTMDSFRKGWMVNPSSASPAPRHVMTLATGLMGMNGAQGARWRRCARCAAAMEDVFTQRTSLQWLVMQQRRCFCGGYFDTITPGLTVA
jgi:mediator of RNA polymerase II transcription subunit 16